jgi:hypothetical protein
MKMSLKGAYGKANSKAKLAEKHIKKALVKAGVPKSTVNRQATKIKGAARALASKNVKRGKRKARKYLK